MTDDNILLHKDKILILRTKLKENFYDYKEKCEAIQELYADGFKDEKTKKDSNKFYIIPSVKWVHYWDICIYIFAMYSLLIFPLDFSFSNRCFMSPSSYYVSLVLDILTSVLFFVDLVLNFFKTHHNKSGYLVTDLKIIAMDYIKSTFINDFLSFIPFNLIFRNDSFKCGTVGQESMLIFYCLCFIRLSKLVKLNDLIEKADSNYINILRLIKLLLFYFYACHFFGCLLTGLTSQIKYVKIYLNSNPASGYDYLSQFLKLYVYCLLMGICSILISDPDLYLPNEKLLVFMLTTISLTVTANIFGYLGLILAKMNSSKITNNENLRDQLDIINEYLLYEQVNEDTRKQINEFYKSMYVRQRMLYEKDLYKELNPNLLGYVKFELWKKVYFENDTLFHCKSISSEFFHRCLRVMEGRIYMKDEVIVEEGESSFDFYLICIHSYCDVIISGLYMGNLKQGEYFGETALFTSSKKRTATVTSKTDGDYLMIPGKEFYKILLDFPNEKGYFSAIAKKHLILYNQIITPKQFGLFIIKKEKVFRNMFHDDLYVNPELQRNVLFYKRNFDGTEKIINKKLKKENLDVLKED